MIVSAPEYEGALVETTGYYGGILPALFFTRDHAEIGDFGSALHITEETSGFISEHCVGHYVRVSGRLKRRLGPGHAGPDPENFEIDDVTKLSILGGEGKETVCWSSEKKKWKINIARCLTMQRLTKFGNSP